MRGVVRSEPQHPVQGSRGEGSFRLLGVPGARAKGITDHARVAAERRLDLGPQIAAAGLLPGHTAAFGDHPNMAMPSVNERCACVCNKVKRPHAYEAVQEYPDG